MSKKLGDWLAAQMKERGWSHNELARRAGVSQPAVSGIVAGRRPSADFCIKVAQVLGESPEKVLRLAGILPTLPAGEDDPDMAEIQDIIKNLPPDKRKEALQYLRYLFKRE